MAMAARSAEGEAAEHDFDQQGAAASRKLFGKQCRGIRRRRANAHAGEQAQQRHFLRRGRPGGDDRENAEKVLPTWLAGSTCKDMDRTPLWGLMQCRIEQVLAFELGRVARLLTPHRLQAR
jgi:hypothetical protein